jgi:hypothetical protein
MQPMGLSEALFKAEDSCRKKVVNTKMVLNFAFQINKSLEQ